MRFVQTAGGRTALPAPRPVRRPPSSSGRRRWCGPRSPSPCTPTAAPSTRSRSQPFPRHWIYDADGRLTHKSGLTDFGTGTAVSFGRHTPWGDEDSPALVTAVETALERALSAQLMRGAARPRSSSFQAGGAWPPGRAGQEIYLVLDGVIAVERDGNGWPSTGPAPCWASGPRWKTAPGRPRWSRSPRAGSRRCPPRSSTGATWPSWPPGTGVKTPRGTDRAGPPCGVRGSTPAPGAEFVRYGGHTRAWPSPRRRHAVRRGSCSTPAPACAGSPGCCAAGPSAARSSSPICTGTTCRGCRSSPPVTAPDAGVTLLLPEQEGGAGAEDVLARGMSPPHFPIGPSGLRGRLVVRHAGARRAARPRASRWWRGRSRTRAAAPTATGSATGIRRGLPPRSLPHRAGPGTRGMG